LATLLGPTYHIIEEGMSGRTTLWEDPMEGYTCGRDYLIPCLKSHKPLDWVILMLGTNDLQRKYRLSAREIADGVGVLVKLILQSECGPDGVAPQVLVVCPPPLGALQGFFVDLFAGASQTSQQLAREYARIAQLYHVPFLEAGQVAHFSLLDGLHLEAPQHETLARAIAALLLQEAR
jgi:lysophospholipase L1-like esterase